MTDPDRSATDADETAAGADQTAADADQTAADDDQTSADRDQAYAEGDQRASDRDQATADRDQAAYSESGAAPPAAYEVSRNEREAGTFSRLLTLSDRGRSAHTRNLTAVQRDGTAGDRDEEARRRDDRAEVIDRAIASSGAPLAEKLERIREHASLDRARAATDRKRAAKDREEAAAERSGLESELNSARLDDLTGAYRREMGEPAIFHEVDWAHRSDRRFVLALIDVDGLTVVNEREGRAAGDRVLQIVVRTIRSSLASFDPVVRRAGNEFMCGLAGTDLDEARRRFDSIAIEIKEAVGVGISVGLAELETNETAEQLTARAGTALLGARGRRPPGDRPTSAFATDPPRSSPAAGRRGRAKSGS